MNEIWRFSFSAYLMFDIRLDQFKIITRFTYQKQFVFWFDA